MRPRSLSVSQAGCHPPKATLESHGLFSLLQQAGRAVRNTDDRGTEQERTVSCMEPVDPWREAQQGLDPQENDLVGIRGNTERGVCSSPTSLSLTLFSAGPTTPCSKRSAEAISERRKGDNQARLRFEAHRAWSRWRALLKCMFVDIPHAAVPPPPDRDTAESSHFGCSSS